MLSINAVTPNYFNAYTQHIPTGKKAAVDKKNKGDRKSAKTLTLNQYQRLTHNINEQTKIEIIEGHIHPMTGVFEKYQEKYYQIYLNEEIITKIPVSYGTKEQVIAELKAQKIKGITIGKKQIQQADKQPLVNIGERWHIPFLAMVDEQGKEYPVYCVDGKKEYPGSTVYPQWQQTFAALNGTEGYIQNILQQGYPLNQEGKLQGTIDQQQIATGAAIWYRLAQFRANPALDWAFGAGTGAYSAYHDATVVGENLRYLLTKDDKMNEQIIKINGQTTGQIDINTFFIYDDFEKSGTYQYYQATDWIIYEGNVSIELPIDEHYFIQYENEDPRKQKNFSPLSGKKFRIINPDILSEKTEQITPQTQIKTLVMLYGKNPDHVQDVIVGKWGNIKMPFLTWKWQKEIAVRFKLYKKIEDETQNFLPEGIIFTLFNKYDEAITDIVIDKKGEGVSSPVSLSKLTPNLYVRETKTLQFLQKNTNKYELQALDVSTLKQNEIIEINTNTTPIINKLTEIKINKKDIKTKQILEGGSLSICQKIKKVDYQGKSVEQCDEKMIEWPIVQEAKTITGLKRQAHYFICEIRAPLGYKQPESCEQFTFPEDQLLSEMSIFNTATKINIHKFSEDGKTYLGDLTAGFTGEMPTFELRLKKFPEEVAKIDLPVQWRDKDLVVDAIWDNFITTDQMHQIIGLPQGFTFELIEKKTREGYQLAEPITFTVPLFEDLNIEIINTKAQVSTLVKTGEKARHQLFWIGTSLLVASVILLFHFLTKRRG